MTVYRGSTLISGKDPIATASRAGIVKPDGTTITVAADGTITGNVGTVTDVQVNGTTVTSSGVANVPIADNSNTLGVIKGGNNLFNVDPQGRPYSVATDYATYSTRNDTVFISKGTLENVITGKELALLTDTITDASTLTLVNNTIYNGTSLTSLTIAYPSTMTTKFISKVNFTTGSSMTITIPSSVKMRGDSCENDLFTPEANSTYSIMFSTVDGTNNYGLVMKM